jgi:hypothetical protein
MRGVVAGAVLLVVVFALACAGSRAPERPDEACAAACEQRIPRCGATECTRGCQLALDRLVENEREPVLACVGRSAAPCDDWLWAECAARVGPHVDGGPPAPLPGLRH